MKAFHELPFNEQLVCLRQILDAALRRYGQTAREGTLLQYENKAVYRIDAGFGEAWVVRIATPLGRSEKEQRSEMRWLEALRRDTKLAVPEPLRNLDGDLVTLITGRDSFETHVCVVLKWMPGEPPESDISVRLMEQIGEVTAGIHRHTEQFVPGDGFIRTRWDWERLFGKQSILADESLASTLSSLERKNLLAAGEQIRRALSGRRFEALSTGLIHGDLHRDNILISDGRVGVIDFDDCGFGYHLYDLACVLDSFQRRVFANTEDYREGRAALLRGYTRVRPLGAGFEECWGVMMAMRDMVTIDFILRSKNKNVQEWGLARVPWQVEQVKGRLGTHTP